MNPWKQLKHSDIKKWKCKALESVPCTGPYYPMHGLIYSVYYCLYVCIVYVIIYPAWDAVFHHQMKQWEESWKYDVQQSIFDKLWGISSGDETLCQMLDITSQIKRFYKEKLRMQNFRAVFHRISQHSLNINFLCIVFMNYRWVWEVTVKCVNSLLY